MLCYRRKCDSSSKWPIWNQLLRDKYTRWKKQNVKARVSVYPVSALYTTSLALENPHNGRYYTQGCYSVIKQSCKLQFLMEAFLGELESLWPYLSIYLVAYVSVFACAIMENPQEDNCWVFTAHHSRRMGVVAPQLRRFRRPPSSQREGHVFPLSADVFVPSAEAGQVLSWKRCVGTVACSTTFVESCDPPPTRTRASAGTQQRMPSRRSSTGRRTRGRNGI